jgi:hypothetical protein
MSEIFKALNYNQRTRNRRNTSQKRLKHVQEWPALPGNSDISSLGSSNFKPSDASANSSGSRSTLQSFCSGQFDSDLSSKGDRVEEGLSAKGKIFAQN